MNFFYKSRLALTLAAFIMIAAAIAIPLSSSSVHTHAQSTVTFTEFPIPSANSGPICIKSGPDGNLWYIEEDANKIGRITPSGTITEFPIPSASYSNPTSITSGPDGNLWFTEDNLHTIGRITPSGTITQFSASSPTYTITSGPDGNLWFGGGNQIGRMTPSGTITVFTLPSATSSIDTITSGPDGNLWFTDFPDQIGKIIPSGTITEFPIPTANTAPVGITSGPDGNLWFTEEYGNQIGRITPSGAITEFPVPTVISPDDYLNYITSGPDGNLWFAEYRTNKIGNITPSGTVKEFSLPNGGGPFGITSGPDSNIWFTEADGNKIGRVNLSSTTPTPSPSPSPSPTPSPTPQPQRTKLFLLMPGFTSHLSAADAASGVIPADTFGHTNGIEVSLKNKFPGSRFVMFSYNGDDGTGKPTAYSCQDTLTRFMTVNVDRLKIQIIDLMKTYQNIDVYLVGHSYGGAVALALDADMKINGQISTNGGIVKGIIALDSPLGGVYGGPLGLYYQAATNLYYKPRCPAATGTLYSLNELTQIFLGGPLYGSNNSLMQIVNGGDFSNQEVADAEVGTTSVLAVGNIEDYIYAPRMCPNASLLPKGKFLSTQLVADQSSQMRVFGRIFVGGRSTCPSITNLGVNHWVVLTNYYVKQGINQFVGNKPITSLAVPAAGFQ